MLRKLACVLLAACLLALPASAQHEPPPDRASGLLAKALDDLRGGDWPSARGTAQRAGPVAVAVIDWHRLRAGHGEWQDFATFLNRYPDWPGLPWLQRQGEAALAADAAPDQVIDYFATVRPQTAAGALALIAAHRSRGEQDRAEAEAVRVWREMDLSEAQEAALLEHHGAALASHHAVRLDALLWRGERAQAERLLPRLGAGHTRLAAARLGLRERVSGVNALIDAVPAELADDAGLAWERFDWRIGNQLYDGASELLVERSTSAAALGRPQAWARWRAWLARRALAEGDARLAYDLAARHFLDDGGDFADLEWLAGYIALRHLEDPATALRHFQHLRVRVGSPISLGRAGYWEGRAHEALGDAESARAAYAFGGEHQTSFYGLLAAERAGLPMDPALAGDERFPDWREAAFADSTVLQAALMLRRAGDWHTARRFILHLAEGLEREELGQLGDLALALGEPNWAVNIAKAAAGRAIVLPRSYFPLTDLAETDLGIPPDLALAIARRESEFDAGVVSPAGARGLMQVMPATGELVARQLGMEFEPARLLGDPVYNARLGAGYLARMIEEFGDATMLVAAAYNAGPGRPRRWIEELGDPRNGEVDPVDWIESVPFTETRNYIMRVMESIQVYRARLAGGPVELRLYHELGRR
jgi:soluble lytic murein transglycosylase